MKSKSVLGLFLITVVLNSLFLSLRSAAAHEFWISPEKYSVAEGENIVAALRVGENFIGNSYSYNPSDFDRFDVLDAGELKPVEGTLGDRPAMNVALPGEGLAVAVHQSDLERLTYSDFKKFEAFATNQDQTAAIEQHKARGLPDEGFLEVYRRFAKSYIQRGRGLGADKKVGMELELVARSNPYTDNGEEVSFELFYKGELRPNTQIVVFNKPDPLTDAVRSTYRTDESGYVSIPKREGGIFLISAVLLVEPDEKMAAETGAVWYSLWASATYQIK